MNSNSRSSPGTGPQISRPPRPRTTSSASRFSTISRRGTPSASKWRDGPAKGKSFDGGNVLGPWIVTPGEIGDPYKLKMEARVNGKMRSQGVTEGMLFSFEEIIAHVTKDETLMPGEFIGSGTVGNGCGLELGWYLEHGDTIELDVEKIGVLKNKVERQDA